MLTDDNSFESMTLERVQIVLDLMCKGFLLQDIVVVSRATITVQLKFVAMELNVLLPRLVLGPPIVAIKIGYATACYIPGDYSIYLK